MFHVKRRQPGTPLAVPEMFHVERTTWTCTQTFRTSRPSQSEPQRTSRPVSVKPRKGLTGPLVAGRPSQYHPKVQTQHRAVIALPLILLALVLAGCSGGVANPEGWASPLVDDNGVTYAFQRKETLSAIDQAGNVKWTFPDDDKEPQKDIELGSVYGTPQLIEGTLYFATYEGDVIAVNAEDGALKWLRDLDESIVGAVAVENGLVSAGTTEGRVFVLKAEDGSAAPGWSADGLNLNRPIWAPVIARDGTLYVATMGGVVRAYKLSDASTTWPADFKTDGAIADLSLLDTGELVVPSLDRHVYFLNSNDGSEAYPPVKLGDWAWGLPAATDSTLVLTDISGDVYAFERGSTTPTWVYSTEDRLKSSPTIINDIVVVADRSPEVHFIFLGDGQRANSVPVTAGGTIRANPTVVDDVAYFITTKGHILKADPEPRTVVEALIGRYQP